MANVPAAAKENPRHRRRPEPGIGEIASMH
jgi:hypothetical protein